MEKSVGTTPERAIEESQGSRTGTSRDRLPLDVAPGAFDGAKWHDMEWAAINDPVVSEVIEAGGDARDCVIALVEQKERLLQRLSRLELIAPRKIKVGSEVFIYRCPDYLVPFAGE